LNSTALGHRGIRLETVDSILALLNQGVLAQVPSRGSVGASGDLAPSAHAALMLIGEGSCTIPVDGGLRTLAASDALLRLGMTPVELAPKEALSLINGTQLTTAYACQAWTEADVLWRTATLALALSTLGFRTNPTMTRTEVLESHHPATLYAGLRKQEWFQGSSLPYRNHEQDPYCFRCAPQVHGAIWKEIEQCEEWVTEELGAATDNPIILPETKEVVHGGNFHAIYPARVLDRLATAMTQLASISERRINLGMDSRKTGLPDFLTPESGLNSGLMMTQTTAAALVSECKALSFPASVDTIPTNCDQEDHVSMGPIAGQKAVQICRNVRDVLAIEILAAFQAIHLRGHRSLPPRLQEVYKILRGHITPIEYDRIFSDDIHRISQLIEDEVLLKDFTLDGERHERKPVQ
jgi:histidine ammonia-lyase